MVSVSSRSFHFLLAIAASVCSISCAFQLSSSSSSSSWGVHQSQHYLPTQLYARGIKKGSLRKNLENTSVDDIASTSSSKSKPKSKQKVNKSNTRKAAIKSKDSSGGVSPTLAQWAASSQNSPSPSSSSSLSKTTSSFSPVAAAEFTSFAPDIASDEEEEDMFDDNDNQKKGKKKKNKNGSSERRARQTQRRKEKEQTRLKTQSIIAQLEELLDVESNRDMDAILGTIRALTDNASHENVASSMKNLCAGTKRRDYRMIWAGSDDAICHVGTGLHKVPLARLQEIFMTVGKSRMEMYEVIRILGPFPNVKNTLKGDISTLKGKSSSSSPQSSSSMLRISFDSMIDGTGKEILAGKEENIRVVECRILFASEDLIVCQTPEKGEEGEDNYENGFGTNGSNLLVFALEEDLDAQLEILRVG